jgi:hypothetical protein
MLELSLLTIVLFIACVYFMRAFLNQKINSETLNEKLNLSDQEYIDLFKENLKIKDELSTLRVLQRIKNL